MANVVEDFLDEDTEIPGQRYVLLSFLSPEKVLDKKELFFFKKFLASYELDWKVKNLEKFLLETVTRINDELDTKARELEKNDQLDSAAICRKHRMSVENTLASYTEFVKKNQESITKTTLAEAYDEFMFTHKLKLEEEFYEVNEFRTSMRGVKVRGVYSNTKEAELKAKKLQTKDKYHNIFMGEVGKWTPWDPNPNEVKDQEYNNEQLNTLMQKYKENEDSREKFFEERTKGSKDKLVDKPVHSQADATADKPVTSQAGKPTESFGDMFNATGDLAHQRKINSVELP